MYRNRHFRRCVSGKYHQYINSYDPQYWHQLMVYLCNFVKPHQYLQKQLYLFQQQILISVQQQMIKNVIRCSFTQNIFNKNFKNVLICPDKFKFSLTASEISQIFQEKLPKNYRCQPILLADGGQGSLQTISHKIKGTWIQCKVLDPLFRSISSKYFLAQNNHSYIQMARASGLQLLPADQRNPLFTSTYGTGQLIEDSLKKGHRKINLLIGGSATNDGGIGVANALGYEFKDLNGKLLKPIGQNLIKIKEINHRNPEMKHILNSSIINVYTDVKNVFTGKNGATRVYGPQKGATPQIVQTLQNGMMNLRQIFLEKYNIDVDNLVGSGAAGGLGGGCSVLLNAQLYRGIDLMFSITNFDELVKQSDLIITGEGKVDRQTLQGKVVKGVIDRAKLQDKKVLVICAYCQNPEDFKQIKNLELIELLNGQEKKIIDPNFTRLRLQKFIKQYSW